MLAGVFIDGAYLSRVLKDYYQKIRIDYHKFTEWASSDYSLFRTYYYDCPPYQSPVPTEEERERVSRADRFFHALSSGQRFVVRKGRLEFRGLDQQGDKIFQQKRVDLQMGLDIASLVAKRRIQVVVLVTGDSDFVPVVEFALQEGVIVRLVHGPKTTYHQDLWSRTDERLEFTSEDLNKMRM